MTPDIVSQLHPPRLPEAFTALGVSDLLAAFGVGLLLAALILTLAAPLLVQRPRRPRVTDQIAAARSLPPEDRLLALLRVLAERGGTLPDDQRAALYEGQADPERIEALLRQAGRRR